MPTDNKSFASNRKWFLRCKVRRLREGDLPLKGYFENGGQDIGLKLGIKQRTVNFHFGKILRKLNAMNPQEAIAKAANANLLGPP